MRPSQVGILTPESLRPTNGSGSAFRAVSHFQALWLALCASAQTPAYPPSWRCAGAGGGGWGLGAGGPVGLCSHWLPAHSLLSVASVSLIECGPVRTAFQGKVQDGLDAVLDSADAQTRDLFSQYQRHFEQVFREAAQDPEEVTEVGARRGSGSGGGAALASSLPAPASFLSRTSAGLPHRAARPAASPALLRLRAHPAPGAAAPR